MSSVAHFETRLSKIYDHLYSNSEFRMPKAIETEIRKLIHTAIYIEKVENPLQPAFSFTKKEQKELEESPSARNRLLIELQIAFKRMNMREKAFEKDEILRFNAFDISFSALQLNGIAFSDSTRDYFGDAAELFRSHWSKSHGGQFFTDQRVTRLAIQLLSFNPEKGERLVDLCAGTGGFLLAAQEEFRFSKSLQNPEGFWGVGFEVDRDVAAIGNGALNSLGRNACVIHHADSLSLNRLQTIDSAIGTYDCAATNPPFGSKITVKDPEVLAKFTIATEGYGPRHKPKSLPLDILFIEQNYRVLKPGGRLAIILPYQTLSGPQARPVRQWIIDRFLPIAIIDLPSETFQPYTGTKTSLLVLEKLKSDQKLSGREKVFMSRPKHIGHDRRGNPVWAKTPTGIELDDVLTDLPEVAEAFQKFKAGRNPASKYTHSGQIALAQVISDPDLRLDAKYHLTPKAKSADLPKTWKVVRLGNSVKSIFFPTRFKRNFTDSLSDSCPFLGGTNISQLIVCTEKRISFQDKYYDQLAVKPGWLLITRSGSTGIVSSVPESWNGYAVSDHVIRIIPDEEALPGAYLEAFLRTRFAQTQIKRGVFGSVIDEISPEHLANLEVPIPENWDTLQSYAQRMKSAWEARETAIATITEVTNQLDEVCSKFGCDV